MSPTHNKAHSIPSSYRMLLLKAELRSDTALFYALLRGWEFTTVNFSSFVDFLGFPGVNTEASPLFSGVYSKMPIGCLKMYIVPNPINCFFFFYVNAYDKVYFIN